MRGRSRLYIKFRILQFLDETSRNSCSHSSRLKQVVIHPLILNMRESKSISVKFHFINYPTLQSISLQLVGTTKTRGVVVYLKLVELESQNDMSQRDEMRNYTIIYQFSLTMIVVCFDFCLSPRTAER